MLGVTDSYSVAGGFQIVLPRILLYERHVAAASTFFGNMIDNGNLRMVQHCEAITTLAHTVFIFFAGAVSPCTEGGRRDYQPRGRVVRKLAKIGGSAMCRR